MPDEPRFVQRRAVSNSTTRTARSTDEVAQVLAALMQRLGRHFKLHTEHKRVRTLQQRAGENEWQADALLLCRNDQHTPECATKARSNVDSVRRLQSRAT